MFEEPPNVSVLENKLTAPAPANVPNVSDAPTPTVAPDATVTAALSTNAAPPNKVSVPAFTATAPVNVFAPPSVNSPDPDFVSPNPPATTPDNVTPDATLKTVSADNVTPPDNVNAPLFVASPSPMVPVAFGLNTKAFASVRAVDPWAYKRVVTPAPGANVTVPEPNAVSFPATTEPAPTETAPLNVFAPLSVNAAAPVFTKPPVPLITPLNAVSAEPPNVRLKLCRFTEPAPATDAIVSAAFSFKVAPEATVTGAVSKTAAPPVNPKVPALTVIPSVLVFVPANVNSADPAFVNINEPVTFPFKVTAL